MEIKTLYKANRPVISFEVFPPKRDSDIAEIYDSLGQMAALSPDFISVTYGAGGGGNSGKTSEIAASIQKEHGVCALAHLTCIGTRREEILHHIADMKNAGIRNVLALRGDLPDGGSPADSYRYASDLIRDLKQDGSFCIGAACYPEGHIDCDDLRLDVERLRQKQEAGADFLITQLFFGNDYFYRFLERARDAGVTLPVSAGIMPILGQKQIERMIFMCGVSLPSGIVKLLHKYAHSPSELRRAGIEYAVKQTEELLAHGVDGVHLYTMNKSDIAGYCMKRIGRT